MAIPGVSAVTGLAVRGIGNGLSVGLQLVSLPVRVIAIVERTESVLTAIEVVARRVEHVSVDVESLVGRANGIVLEVRAVVDGARESVAGAASMIAAVDPLLARTAATIEQAALFAQRAEALIGDGERMLGEVRPVVEKALPSARRFVEQLSEQEVDAAIAMVDELPELAQRLKNDIVPILATLDGLAPNVAELVKLTDDVRQAILGIPGFGRLRRRGAEKLEEAGEDVEADKAKAKAKAIEPTKADQPDEPGL